MKKRKEVLSLLLAAALMLQTTPAVLAAGTDVPEIPVPETIPADELTPALSGKEAGPQMMAAAPAGAIEITADTTELTGSNTYVVRTSADGAVNINATLNVTGNDVKLHIESGTLNVSEITIQQGAKLTITGADLAQGYINISQTSLTNHGTLVMESGVLGLSLNSLINEAGATLTMTGGCIYADKGNAAIVNRGTLELSGGEVALASYQTGTVTRHANGYALNQESGSCTVSGTATLNIREGGKMWATVWVQGGTFSATGGEIRALGDSDWQRAILVEEAADAGFSTTEGCTIQGEVCRKAMLVTLTIDGNGGVFILLDIDPSPATNTFQWVKGDRLVDIPAQQRTASRAGYKLIGYSTDQEGQHMVELVPDTDATLYVQWKKEEQKKCAYTLMSNGGSFQNTDTAAGATPDQWDVSLVPGTPPEQMPQKYKPIREGYKLVGWTIVKDGTEVIQVLPEKGTTLYAKWERIEGAHAPVRAEDTEWNSQIYTATGTIDLANCVEVMGKVTLFLEEGCVLNAKKGIHVQPGATFTIDGTGTLNAYNNIDDYNHIQAAIGGRDYDDSKSQAERSIIINGGCINANMDVPEGTVITGPAIGAQDEKIPTNITINDGTVHARAGKGACIGVGQHGTILITGGTVTADKKCAAKDSIGTPIIGASQPNFDGKIELTGGSITAQNHVTPQTRFAGAGIGGPQRGSPGTILIDGATVVSEGPIGGAGDQAETGSVTINSGSVTVRASQSAGIGCCPTVALNGGTVKISMAKGSNAQEPAIGNVGTLTIKNAVVEAKMETVIASYAIKAIDRYLDRTGWIGLVTEDFTENGKDKQTLTTVYGTMTLPEAYEVTAGAKMVIPSGAKLIVSKGVTLTNNGTIDIAAGGKLDWKTQGGQLSGNPPVGPGAKEDQADLTLHASSTMVVGETQTLSVSGGSGNGAVTYQVTGDTGSVTIDGAKLTAKAVGTVTVTATKAGDDTYTESTSAPVTITIAEYADGGQVAALDLTVNTPTVKTRYTTADGGTMAYEPGANTLTMTGATLTGELKLPAGATVVLVDENKAGKVEGTCTINGTGTLTVTSMGTGVTMGDAIVKETGTKTLHVGRTYGLTDNDPLLTGVTKLKMYNNKELHNGGENDFSNVTAIEGSFYHSLAEGGVMCFDTVQQYKDIRDSIRTNGTLGTIKIGGTEILTGNGILLESVTKTKAWANLDETAETVTTVMTYDPDTKTLTMEKNAETGESITMASGGCTVIVKGTNKLGAVNGKAPLTVQGSGKLELNAIPDEITDLIIAAPDQLDLIIGTVGTIHYTGTGTAKANVLVSGVTANTPEDRARDWKSLIVNNRGAMYFGRDYTLTGGEIESSISSLEIPAGVTVTVPEGREIGVNVVNGIGTLENKGTISLMPGQQFKGTGTIINTASGVIDFKRAEDYNASRDKITDQGGTIQIGGLILPKASDFTVTDNSQIYNGQIQKPTVTGKEGMGAITVNTTLTAVGKSATISISVAEGEKYCALKDLVLNIPFEVKQKTVTIADGTLELKKVYDGKTDTLGTVTEGTALALEGRIGSDDVKVNITSIGQFADQTAGKNKRVTLGVELTGTKAKCYKLDGAATYVFSKAEITKAIPTADLFAASETSKVYNGGAQSPVVAVKSNVEGMGTVTVTTSATNVDEVNDSIAFSVAVGTNYEAADLTLNQSFTITQADAAVTAPTGVSGLIYNGKSQTLVNAGSSTFGTVRYKLGADGQWSSSLPAAVTAGDYTVYYKVDGTGNYNGAAEQQLTVNIARKNISGAAITLGQALTYNGQTQTQNIASVVIDGLDVTYDVSNNTGKDAGTGYTLTVTGNGNFEGSQTQTFAIRKARYDMTGVTFADASIVYDGRPHGLLIGGTLPTGADGKQVTVTYSGTATDVADGAVTVTAAFATESTNYEVPAAMTAQVTITPRPITGASVTLGQALAFTGAEQTQSIASVKIDGLDVTYDVAGSTGTDADTYTMTLTGKGNFEGEITQDFTIAAHAGLTLTADTALVKNAPNFTAELDLTQVSGYPADGKGAVQFAIDTKDLGADTTAVVDAATGRLTITADKDQRNTAGSVVIQVTGMQNYEDSRITVNVRYTDKQPVTITGVAVADKVYDVAAIRWTGAPVAADANGQTVTPAKGFTYEWQDRQGKSLTGAPVNAGQYQLKIMVHDDDVVYMGSATVAFEITKAPVTITMKDQTIYVRGELPQLDGTSYTVEGLLADHVLAGDPTMGFDPAQPDVSHSGEIRIVASGASVQDQNDNYAITYVPGTLTVRNRPIVDTNPTVDRHGQKNPDGSTTITEVKQDGTKVETTQGVNGRTEVITKPDGSSVTTVQKQDGSTSKTTVSKEGRTEIVTTVTDRALNQAGGKPVTLPVPPVSSQKETTIRVDLPRNEATRIVIPVENVKPGTIVVQVKPDGTEQVLRKAIATEEGLVLEAKGDVTLKVTDNRKSFSDSGNHWAHEAIDFVTSRGIFNGNGDGSFTPNQGMSRGMLAVVLHNLENNPEKAFSGDFTDVPAGQWYAEAISWAADQKLVLGYDNGGFGPNDLLTREQLAVMLWRYAGMPAASAELKFGDAAAVSDWAQPAMQWAVENGIIFGTDTETLSPQETATRAQVATMVMRFLNSMNK